MPFIRRARILVLFALLLLGVIIRAEERILNFHSDITVNADATMQVSETIAVQCENVKINHGIYRDFPTRYRVRGKMYRVGFNITSVMRDGQSEPYYTLSMKNGIRVYIGAKDIILNPGKYTYQLTYTTDRQLGFFPDHDELYRNVTGNGWEFPIDKASATVLLPTGVPAAKVNVEGYTGPKGSKARDLTAKVDAAGRAQFATTHSLAPQEGLTIVAAFPKGFVKPPPKQSASDQLLEDYRTQIYAGIALLALLLGYYFTWLLVGKDPPRGIIIPQYTPPSGLSPAAVRYLTRMGADDTGIAAALVNLAVKGHLVISEAKGQYTLTKTGKTDARPASDEEQSLLDGFFIGDPSLEKGSLQLSANPITAVKQVITAIQTSRTEQKDSHEQNSIVLTNSHADVIQKAVKAAKTNLAKAFGGNRYFVTNAKVLILGIIFTLPLLLLVAWLTMQPNATEPFAGISGEGDIAVGYIIGTLFLLIGGAVFVGFALPAWKQMLKGDGCGGGCLGLFLTVWCLGFGGGGALLLASVSITYLLFLLAAIAVTAIFAPLLTTYTPAGRALLDAIEGYRLYLSVGERDRLEAMNAPEKTPELFETYLPYALALGVEQQWAQQFAAVFAAAGIAAAHYAPGWYSGMHSMNAGSLASSLGSSFSSSVSSASTPPGSSSGSGGGGSSGGGGGGGGGGGW